MELSIALVLAKAKLAAETFQMIKFYVVDEVANVLSTMGDGELRAAIAAADDTRLGVVISQSGRSQS